MILFTIKLISSIRKAIAGRRYPSQLAWGVALGVLLGVIPHGNLLAVVLVLAVLMLQVNHAVVALVGVGLTFIAPRFDSQFDSVGRWFFDQPDAAKAMASAWQLPLVPWSDLNNTVVMGSFLIGLAAVLPTFLLTYPVFKKWAAAMEDDSDDQVAGAEENPSCVEEDLPSGDASVESTEIRMDGGHLTNQPHTSSVDATDTHVDSLITASSGRVYDVRRIDSAESKSSNPVPAPSASRTKVAIQPEPMNADVEPSENSPGSSSTPVKSTLRPSTVRMTPVKAGETNNSKIEVEADGPSADDQQKIDEALSYLLRQLRDSKDKDAA